MLAPTANGTCEASSVNKKHTSATIVAEAKRFYFTRSNGRRFRYTQGIITCV